MQVAFLPEMLQNCYWLLPAWNFNSYHALDIQSLSFRGLIHRFLN